MARVEWQGGVEWRSGREANVRTQEGRRQAFAGKKSDLKIS